MKYRFLSLLLALPLLSGALSLDDAIAQAKEHNRALQKARENIASIDADYRNVRGSFFPQISLSAGYTLSKTWLPDSSVMPGDYVSGMMNTSDDLSTPYGLNDTLLTDNDETLAGLIDGMLPAKESEEASLAAQIKLDQVVFMGGKLINGLRVAGKVRTITRKNYFLIEQDVIYQTTDMFYMAVLAERVVAIQQEALDTAEQHLSLVEDMYAQGLVSEYDLLRAKLEVARLRPELLNARNNLHLAMESLQDQIGWEGGEMQLEGDIVLPAMDVPSLEDAIAEGLTNRIELDLSSIQVDIKDVLYRTERGNYLPNIAISAEYDKFTAADDFNIESDDYGDKWQVGIGFQMPLFTGLSNTAKAAKARHELNKARLDHNQLMDNIELDVRNSWQKLQYSLQNVSAQQENIDLAAKGLTIAEARFQNSVGIQLEVLDAQLQSKSTRLQYLQAVYQATMDWEALQKALGRSL